jgi:outer membrane protein
MKTRWPFIVIALLLLGNIALGLWSLKRTPRIAYVRSQELVYGYFGMKEAMNSFQLEQEGWKANMDTLATDLRRNMAALNDPGSGGPDRTQSETAVRKQRDDLARYADAMEKKLQQKEQEMLASVLGQVNSFIEQYAAEKGYDMVLGTTDEGSLLYGDGAMDITEEVLTALNEEHQGTKP